MKRLKLLLLAVAVAGVVLVPLAADVFCQGATRVPRRPVRAMPAVPVLWQDVAVTAPDGGTLRGWYAAAPASDNCVLLLHGIADTSASMGGFAAMLLDRGYSALATDHRGHGRSGGDRVTYGLLERHDALAWAAWLRRQGCRRVYGLGESLGAAVLIQASAVEPAFRAIVAECSYADLRSVGVDRVRMMAGRWAPLAGPLVGTSIVYARLRYGLDFDDASPERAIARASTPTLLIHGLADQRTRPDHSRRLARANPRVELWLVPGADHVAATAAAPAEFSERVLGWFERHR